MNTVLCSLDRLGPLDASFASAEESVRTVFIVLANDSLEHMLLLFLLHAVALVIFPHCDALFIGLAVIVVLASLIILD